MARFHATVHDQDARTVFECHVIGENSGSARESVKEYLRKQGREDEAKMLIALMELRDDIESPLTLVR
jgi:hypothetical protein